MTAPVTNAETAIVIMILRKNAKRLRQVVEAHKQVAYDAHTKLYKAEAKIAKLKNERDLWIDRAEQLWSMYERDAPTPDNSVTWFDDMGAAKRGGEMSELRRTWMRRVDNTYEVYNADTVDAEIASLKADIRQWLNEAQRQQKIAAEAYAEIAKLKETRYCECTTRLKLYGSSWEFCPYCGGKIEEAAE